MCKYGKGLWTNLLNADQALQPCEKCDGRLV
jgi:hypothetical protein